MHRPHAAPPPLQEVGLDRRAGGIIQEVHF